MKVDLTPQAGDEKARATLVEFFRHVEEGHRGAKISPLLRSIRGRFENALPAIERRAWNNGFEAGLERGRDEGKSEGFSAGYDFGRGDGVRVGHEQGYKTGYEQGLIALEASIRSHMADGHQPPKDDAACFLCMQEAEAQADTRAAEVANM